MPRPGKVGTPDAVAGWVKVIPLIKSTIDFYFTEIRDNREKECQQLIVRENNRGTKPKKDADAKKYAGQNTDYYICDTEYVKGKARYDLAGVKWPSTSNARRKTSGLRLALMELKFGKDALQEGKSGIVDHVRDLNKFLADKAAVRNLKEELVSIFRQKVELSLIDAPQGFAGFSEDKPEFILLLANLHPRSSILEKQLAKLEDLEYFPLGHKAEIRIATSNFMGYGLFEESIYSLADFRQRFQKQIYAEGQAAD